MIIILYIYQLLYLHDEWLLPKSGTLAVRKIEDKISEPLSTYENSKRWCRYDRQARPQAKKLPVLSHGPLFETALLDELIAMLEMGNLRSATSSQEIEFSQYDEQMKEGSTPLMQGTLLREEGLDFG